MGNPKVLHKEVSVATVPRQAFSGKVIGRRILEGGQGMASSRRSTQLVSTLPHQLCVLSHERAWNCPDFEAVPRTSQYLSNVKANNG
jgi:hypothetical protein